MPLDDVQESVSYISRAQLITGVNNAGVRVVAHLSRPQAI